MSGVLGCEASVELGVTHVVCGVCRCADGLRGNLAKRSNANSCGCNVQCVKGCLGTWLLTNIAKSEPPQIIQASLVMSECHLFAPQHKTRPGPRANRARVVAQGRHHRGHGRLLRTRPEISFLLLHFRGLQSLVDVQAWEFTLAWGTTRGLDEDAGNRLALPIQAQRPPSKKPQRSIRNGGSAPRNEGLTCSDRLSGVFLFETRSLLIPSHPKPCQPGALMVSRLFVVVLVLLLPSD